jgi:hypothetical protein
MTKSHDLRIRPAWVLKLTNAGLTDAFGSALDARETRNDAPDLMRRLDILYEEISRREWSGMLVEDDWIADGPATEGEAR